MYYLVYKITNLINGKFYIGVHKTKNKNDGYMGSGKNIRAAVKKYGVENFTKEILFEAESSEEMYNLEKEIVNNEFILREDVYNICEGGLGGVGHLNGFNHLNSWVENPTHSSEHIQMMTNCRLEKLKDDSFKRRWSENISKSLKSKCQQDPEYVEILKKNRREGALLGSLNAHTDEANEKRKKTVRDKKLQQGENNSQFGTCWIIHEIYGNKKIKKEDINFWIEKGWRKGYDKKWKENHQNETH